MSFPGPTLERHSTITNDDLSICKKGREALKNLGSVNTSAISQDEKRFQSYCPDRCLRGGSLFINIGHPEEGQRTN